jgi:hypothetical protein
MAALELLKKKLDSAFNVIEEQMLHKINAVYSTP